MRTINGIISLVALLSGCGFLKTTIKETQSDKIRSNTASINQQETNFRKTEFNKNVDWKKDSIIQGGNYTIWPEGIVSYSIDSGFKGVAKKIEVKGNIKSVSEITRKNSQQINVDSSSVKLDSLVSKTDHLYNTNKQLSSPAMTPFKIFLGIIFAFVCYAWFKKLKIR